MKLRPLSVVCMLIAGGTLAVQAQYKSATSHQDAAAPAAIQSSRTPVKFRRAPDNTFLTYPEWFLVWSPREYAQFINGHPPSEFPFLRHIGHFWQGYAAIYESTKEKPFNVDYHSMIWVIGASMTGENAATRAYETLIGRVGEAADFHGPTSEDKLAARVAADYAAFLDVQPWYKFDFVQPLKQVWTQTGFWGADPIRKWERKYFLTTQYAFKAGYAWLIWKSSESAYGIESETTIVVLDQTPQPMVDFAPKILEQFPDGATLVELPRYQAFTPAAIKLAKSGIRFLEIAGNQGPILITAIVPETFDDTGIHLLFTQPIITHPGRKRIAFTVPVPELSAKLLKLQGGDVELEHIYDF